MNKGSDIAVTIGGDFCPVGRPQVELLDGSSTEESIVGSGRLLFADSDIGIVNLECPLSEHGKPIYKTGRNLRANPKMIRLLSYLGVTDVALANNHVRDYGDIGVADTLAICAANGIRTVGAGASQEAARQPLYVSSKGRKLAFVNVAEQEFGIATRECAGANPLDLIDLLRDLRKVQTQADHVIVVVHGGLEFTHCPSPASVKLLRFLSEQGVTAVVRHHSHYVQGYEVWKGVPIFYGLGNMLFDLGPRMDADWYQGLVVRLKISPENTCGIELCPIHQCGENASVTMIEDDAKMQALRSIDEYSALLADETALFRAWAAALRSVRTAYLSNLLVPSYPIRRIFHRLGLMRFVHLKGRSAQAWENVLRCDTHREALIDILRQEQKE